MARTKKQNDEMREVRLKQIRKEALRQFSINGLTATKIKDIAIGVNMSQGLIYHYYKSKEEIFIELINDALDKLNQAVFSLKTLEMQPHEKLKLAIKELLLTINESEDFTQTCRLIAQATNTNAIPEDAKKLLEEKRNIPYIEIAHIMEEGQILGTIIEEDPMELAVAFWTSINGIAIYKATNNKQVAIPNTKILERMFIK